MSCTRTRLDSIARSRLDSISSLSRPRTRTRTWSDALLARIYSNRYSSPPEYEPPPPYNVALQMEIESEKPPEYSVSALETLV